MGNQKIAELNVECVITSKTGPNCIADMTDINLTKWRNGVVTISEEGNDNEINLSKDNLIKILEFLNKYDEPNN